MSAPSRPLRLTDRAQRDYDDLLLYSEQTWGNEQADRYEAAMAEGFDTLQINPRIGVARDHLLPGLRVYFIQRHVVYYRIVAEVVEVVRILHERADPARHLRL